MRPRLQRSSLRLRPWVYVKSTCYHQYLIVSFRSPWFKYASLFFVVKNFFAIVLSISKFSSGCFNVVTLFLDDLVSLLFSWAFVFGYDNCRNYGFFYGFGYFNNFWFKKSFFYLLFEVILLPLNVKAEIQILNGIYYRLFKSTSNYLILKGCVLLAWILPIKNFKS